MVINEWHFRKLDKYVVEQFSFKDTTKYHSKIQHNVIILQKKTDTNYFLNKIFK